MRHIHSRPPWVRQLVCRLLGHETWSYSVPAKVPSMPDIKRLGVEVCDRCGDKTWTVNQP